MNLSKTIPYFSVKDHSVSGETFELLYHEAFDMLITNPQPSLENLPRYYETEDYISHTDGKRTLFEKLYQFVKNIALKRKLKLISSSSETGTLLDIGAGTGDFLLYCKKNGWNVTGIEPSQKASLIANKKGLDYVTSLSNLKDNSFDIITMWHVLEHVPDLYNQIKELKRLLKPNGTLFVAVPNFKSYDANYYGEFWAAFDVPIHFWHFSKTAIKKLFFEQNMVLTKIKPMKFDSYYVALLSEKYKTGKMNFVRAFVIGAISNWKARRNLEFSSLIYVIKHKN